MRHIVRVFTYDELQLIAGEWEEMPVEEKEIIDECETLEEALEMLEVYKHNAGEYESYYIGYDDKALELEEWEQDWLDECAIQDRNERKRELESRRYMPWDDDYDEDMLDDADYEYEEEGFEASLEEYGLDKYDW